METPVTERDSRWCLGLPFAESSPFTEAEAVAVRGRVHAFLLGMAVAALFVVAALLAMAGLELRNPQGTAATITSAVDVLLALLAIPGALILFASFATFYRDARRDSKGGAVAIFRGEIHPRTPNRVRDRIERSALVRLPGEGSLEIRVLPHSRRWLRPLPTPRARFEFLRVRIQRAAPPPEYAWRVPVHRDLPVIPAPGIQLEQRQLTELERVELASYARELRRPGLHQWIGLVTTTMLLWTGVRQGPGAGHGILVAAAVILLAVHTRAWFRRMGLAGRLQADLSSGRVLSAAPSDEAASEPAPTDPGAREFLPMSRMLWTELGRPAAWRQSPELARAAA